MYISKLIINNYKSIKDEEFIFNKGINILVGKNNAGKSNIVSALNEILADKYNTTSYEDKIFYTDSSNKIKKEFKIIAEVQDINNLDYSLLDNIKKKTALLGKQENKKIVVKSFYERIEEMCGIKAFLLQFVVSCFAAIILDILGPISMSLAMYLKKE